MKNIYQDTYLSLINEWNNLFQQKVLQSKTDYTPDEFVNKIFDDIKGKGLYQDFVLQYTLKDFNKYVTPQNYTHYKEFQQKFKNKKQNFSIVILNWSIYNEEKLKKILKDEYQKIKKEQLKQKIINKSKNINYKDSKTIIKKFKDQLKQNISDIYTKCINTKNLSNIKLKSENSVKLLKKAIYFLGIPKYNFAENENKNITSEDLFITDMNNLLQQLFSMNFKFSRVQSHFNTYGECCTASQCNGFLYFINRNLSNKNNLSQLFKLINHEIDHFFEGTIYDKQEDKGKDQKDLIDGKSKKIIDTESFTKDKEFLYYLFERSQFNSRGTDCCNLLLQGICPKYKKNSLIFFVNKIKELSLAKNEDEIKVLEEKFSTNISNIKNSQDIIAPLYFAAATLKLFPDTKWKILLKRLQDDFKQYMDLSPQQQQKYAEQVASHMKPHSKKADQVLKKMQQATPKQQAKLQKAAEKLQKQQKI